MRRFITQQDLDLLYLHFAQTSVDIYNAEGEVAPQLFCVTLADEPGMIAQLGAVPPTFIQPFYQTSDSKDQLHRLMQALLREGSPLRDKLREGGMPLPDVVVQISEIWLTPVSGLGPDAVERIDREGVSNQPDKEEAVMVALHTEDASVLGICPIESGRAIYRALDPNYGPSGRFVQQTAATRH